MGWDVPLSDEQGYHTLMHLAIMCLAGNAKMKRAIVNSVQWDDGEASIQIDLFTRFKPKMKES